MWKRCSFHNAATTNCLTVIIKASDYPGLKRCIAANTLTYQTSHIFTALVMCIYMCMYICKYTYMYICTYSRPVSADFNSLLANVLYVRLCVCRWHSLWYSDSRPWNEHQTWFLDRFSKLYLCIMYVNTLLVDIFS